MKEKFLSVQVLETSFPYTGSYAIPIQFVHSDNFKGTRISKFTLFVQILFAKKMEAAVIAGFFSYILDVLENFPKISNEVMFVMRCRGIELSAFLLNFVRTAGLILSKAFNAFWQF